MSKAEALVALQRARHSSLIIDEFVAFTDEEWSHSQRSVLRRIGDAGLGPIVAVRSSAAGESFEQTEAPGRFHTELGVPLSDYPRLVDAIDRVRQSMASTARGGVIIQTQLTETTMAGVATTIDIRGVPYTTVEYDDQSGRTDAVTSGDAVKRALIADLTAPPIGKWTALSAAILDVQATLNSDDLVIEFAVDTTGQVHVFQAWTRRQRSNVGRSMLREAVAAAQAQVEDLRAASNSPLVLSDMTDWNPAEILGATPRPLAVSLYPATSGPPLGRTSDITGATDRCSSRSVGIPTSMCVDLSSPLPRASFRPRCGPDSSTTLSPAFKMIRTCTTRWNQTCSSLTGHSMEKRFEGGCLSSRNRISEQLPRLCAG